MMPGTFLRALAIAVLYLFVATLALQNVFAQDEPAPGARKQDAEREDAGEEGRESLKRHIRARLLLKNLENIDTYEKKLAELDELGFEAVEEMLSSLAEPAKKALQELCKRRVGRLSDDDFKIRDRAFRLLYAAGDTSVEMLKKAAQSQDVHLADKSRLLLHMIDRRISPELHERLGHVMADYEKADWRKKLDMIDQLERLGGSLAVPALRRIVEREQNPRVKAQAANSLIRVGTIEDLVFIQKTGLIEKLDAPALTVEIYLSQGMKYLEAERYEEAIREFKRALKDAPDDIRIHYELGMAYLLAKKFALSVTHYMKVLNKEPENVLAHYNLACAYSLMNDTDNAIKHLALSIENGYGDVAHMEKDTDLDNIRSEPRYKALKEKLEREKEEEKKDDNQQDK